MQNPKPDPKKPEPQEPDDVALDLEGMEIMHETFGAGRTKRTLLVNKGMTLKQLVDASR